MVGSSAKNINSVFYPLQKVLREEIKEKFKYDVDRTSPSNKIRDFMDWSSDIIQDIKYQRRVHANPIGRLLVNVWYVPLYTRRASDKREYLVIIFVYSAYKYML